MKSDCLPVHIRNVLSDFANQGSTESAAVATAFYVASRLDQITDDQDAFIAAVNAEKDKLRFEIVRLNSVRENYESKYILPTFEWANELGIDLQALVGENTGKNCVELFFNELRSRIEALNVTINVQQRETDEILRQRVKIASDTLEQIRRHNMDIEMLLEESRSDTLDLYAEEAAEPEELPELVGYMIRQGKQHGVGKYYNSQQVNMWKTWREAATVYKPAQEKQAREAARYTGGRVVRLVRKS